MSKIALSVDKPEFNTILAALRYYQWNGLGDPANRSNDIHEIAIDGDEISLDEAAIDALCERLNCPPAPPPTPTFDEIVARHALKLESLPQFRDDTMLRFVCRLSSKTASLTTEYEMGIGVAAENFAKKKQPFYMSHYGWIYPKDIRAAANVFGRRTQHHKDILDYVREKAEPDLQDVVMSLVRDADAEHEPLNDWLENLGYEPTLTNIQTYLKCCEFGRKLRKMVGHEDYGHLRTLAQEY